MKTAIRLVLLSVLLLSTLLSGGCTNLNYNEPEDLEFVAGMAIDISDNGKLLLTVELESVTSGENPQLEPVYMFSEEDTLFGAMRNFLKYHHKTIYWGHAKVVILSQEAASTHMEEVLDTVSRLPQVRLSIIIAVSKEKTAREVLMVETGHKDIPMNSDTIMDSIKIQERLGKTPNIQLYEILDSVADEGQAAVCPAVGIKKIEDSSQLDISGAAIFVGTTFMGFLDEYDTRTMDLLVGVDKITTLELPPDPGGYYDKACIEIIVDKASIKPSLEEGKAVVDITIDANIRPTSIVGISKDDKLIKAAADALCGNAAQYLEGDINALLDQSKSLGNADVLGIGSKLQDAEPALWKQIKADWPGLYQDLKANVNVNVKIRNFGMVIS